MDTKIPLKLVFLQSAVSIPGGELNTDSTLSQEKCKNLEAMEWRPEGLFLHLKSGKIAIVPHANVKIALIDNQVKASKPAKH
jgi:hypothetical protein